MYCKNCGNKTTPGASVCEICGNDPSRGDNYCPNCGHICIPGDEKCVSCGYELLSVPSVTVAPPPLPQTENQPNKGTPDISTGPKFLASGQCYCRNCGLVIPNDAFSCPYCDTPKGQGENYCPNCGSGTIESDNVCPVCATKLTPVKPGAVNTADYVPSPPPAKTSGRGNGYTINNTNNYNTVNYNMNGRTDSGEKSDKSKELCVVLAILPAFFGFFGIHRLYTGHIAVGLVQLFTFGMCGIWQIIDVIMILMGNYKDYNGKKI